MGVGGGGGVIREAGSPAKTRERKIEESRQHVIESHLFSRKKEKV